jgi:hypothetical protein
VWDDLNHAELLTLERTEQLALEHFENVALERIVREADFAKKDPRELYAWHFMFIGFHSIGIVHPAGKFVKMAKNSKYLESPSIFG